MLRLGLEPEPNPKKLKGLIKANKRIVSLRRKLLGRTRIHRGDQARRIAFAIRQSETTKQFVPGKTFSAEDAEEAAKRFLRGKKVEKIQAVDLFALGTKYSKTGKLVQTPYRFDVTFVSKRLFEPYTRDQLFGDFGKPAFMLHGDPVNRTIREQVVEAMGRIRKTPAYLQFYVFGLTPGNSRGDGRSATTHSTYKFFRASLDPGAEFKENRRMFIERAIRSGLSRLGTLMAQDFEGSPGPVWTVLKLTTEMGFEEKPNKKELLDILRRAERHNALGLIKNGKKLLKKLRSKK